LLVEDKKGNAPHPYIAVACVTSSSDSDDKLYKIGMLFPTEDEKGDVPPPHNAET